MQSLNLALCAIVVLASCKTLKNPNQNSELSGISSATVYDEGVLSLKVSYYDKMDSSVYFRNPRIAGEIYWDLKPSKISLLNSVGDKISMSELDTASKAFAAKALATGNPHLIVDVYQNDKWFPDRDTLLGYLVVPVAEIENLENSSITKVIQKGKMKIDGPDIEVVLEIKH